MNRRQGQNRSPERDAGGAAAQRHLRLGEAGEEMAARFLENKGLRIVARRVRLRGGELDIVARDGAYWVFVEVKTRAHDRKGLAAEAMTRGKIRRLSRAVREYCARHGLFEQPMRCDVVAIDFDDQGLPAIVHHPAAVTLEERP